MKNWESKAIVKILAKRGIRANCDLFEAMEEYGKFYFEKEFIAYLKELGKLKANNKKNKI